MSFTIDSKEFHLNPIFDDSMLIRSTLGHYRVVFQDLEDPFKGIYAESKTTRVFLIIDSNVLKLWNMANLDKTQPIFLVESTEENKTITMVMFIIDFLERYNFTKSDCLIAVGGGLVQDLVGFAAHIYKRGINWIYYPTTLLSMADSCIGGKTGINTNKAKNQLGVFDHPIAIYVNPNFLKTLPQCEIESGMGEIVKMCLIGGSRYIVVFQNDLLNKSLDYLHLIKLSLSIKQTIVEADEFEKYYRKTLNYGHTIGHALETLSDYRLTHGQAIIIGMFAINQWYHSLGKMEMLSYETIQFVLQKLISPQMVTILQSLPLEQFGNLIKRDKKATNEYIRFAVVRSLGDNEFYDAKITDELFDQLKIVLKTINYV